MSTSSTTSSNKTWKSVRPWLPPSSSGSNTPSTSNASSNAPSGSNSENLLHLKVLDVHPTSLALSIHTDPALFQTKPLVSISLDGKPWPHVEENDEEDDRSGGGTTVLVYGLEEGRDYQVGLEVVSPGDEDEDDRDREQREELVDRHHHQHNSSFDDNILTSAEEPPPPPYTPTPPPTIDTLRSHLKTLRVSTRRTEASLQSSLSALKKAVEKGLKEDQRARTRIVSLEEAIRKAEEGERDASPGGTEWERVVRDYESELQNEQDWKDKLEDLRTNHDKDGKEKEKEKEKERDDDESGTQLAELVRELDSINKAIEEATKTRDTVVTNQLQSLEAELTMMNEAIVSLSNNASHSPRHYPSNPYSLSSDSLPLQHHHPHLISPSLPLAHPPQQQQPSQSSFGLRWRRGPPNNAAPAPDRPPGQSNATFGRFFRRGVSDPNVILPLDLHVPAPSTSTASSGPPPGFSYQFAKDRQHRWAAGAAAFNSQNDLNGMSRLEPSTSRSSLEVPSFSSNMGGGGNRRRSGSLGSGFSATSSSSRSSLDQPPYNQLAIQPPPKEGAANTGGANKGNSWGRLATWSQVVRKESKEKDKKKKDEESKSLGVVEDAGEGVDS